MIFVETVHFVRVAASLFDDEGLRHLQESGCSPIRRQAC